MNLGRYYKILRFLIKRKLFYKIRNSWIVWFYFLNNAGRLLYQKTKPNLNNIQKRIIDEWNENGIAVTRVDELFPNEHLLGILSEYAEGLIDKAESKDKKKFLKFLFDLHPVLNFKNPYAKLALERRVLDIVNGYMGMCAVFRTMTLNITVPVGEEALPVDSQRWHRDPEDKIVCKMFLYLTDVDENSGPFIYALGTHHKGRWRKLFPTDPPAGSYPPAEEVEKIIPKDMVKVFTGSAGTIIFCETTGLHKGGYAKTKERLMYTSMYSSKKSMHPAAFLHQDGGLARLGDLDEVQKYAI